MSITADEFFHKYAENSKTTVEELKSLGCSVAPCDCDYENCPGWQVVSEKEISPGMVAPNEEILNTIDIYLKTETADVCIGMNEHGKDPIAIRITSRGEEFFRIDNDGKVYLHKVLIHENKDLAVAFGYMKKLAESIK